jgi:hypothetical protein
MDMLTLTRGQGADQGTPGRLKGPFLSLFALELPWRDNRRQMSCIPSGQYVCKPFRSATFGDCWLLQDVPGRSAVLFHAGNLAGDSTLNFRTNSQGCILVGTAMGTAHNQLAVLSSQAGMRLFREFYLGKSFNLNVIGGKS